jgi:hypothetical protein
MQFYLPWNDAVRTAFTCRTSFRGKSHWVIIFSSLSRLPTTKTTNDVNLPEAKNRKKSSRRSFPRQPSSLHSPSLPTLTGTSTILLIPNAAGVPSNPFLLYSFCAGGSAINVTSVGPAGARSSISRMIRLKMTSPSPRRWCSGSTTMSTTWKTQPPLMARPMAIMVGVGVGADGSV